MPLAKLWLFPKLKMLPPLGTDIPTALPPTRTFEITTAACAPSARTPTPFPVADDDSISSVAAAVAERTTKPASALRVAVRSRTRA